MNFETISLFSDEIRDLKFGDNLKAVNKNGITYYTVLVSGSVPLIRNNESYLSERLNRDEYNYYKEKK